MKESNTQPELISTFNKSAEIAEHKIAERLSRLPEADRLAYQDLIQRQHDERLCMVERHNQNRPELLEREFLRAMAAPPSLKYDLGSSNDYNSHVINSRKEAKRRVHNMEVHELGRADARSFEARLAHIKDAEWRKLHNARNGRSPSGNNSKAHDSDGKQRGR